MKRKLYLITALALTLLFSGGAYAYTYPSSSNVFAVTEPTGDIATVAEAALADQPSWDDVMPEPVMYSEVIRPSASGDLTENDRYPSSGQNWDKVDEATPDEWTTYVYNTSKWEHTDLYHLTDLTEDLPISSITVYFRIAGSSTTAFAKPAIETYGTVFLGPSQSQPSGTFDTKSYQWTNNPSTNQPWTTDEVNQLQAGVALTKPSGGGFVACTQVYVEVSYDFLITEGEVPTGDLFIVNPHTDYSGDLLVKIYLLNTGSLIKAYQYLNMKLYLENSVEAGETPDYRVLSLENGMATFNLELEGGNAANYTLSITGGGYRLVSDDSNQWGDGWSVIPEFYCQVTQR